MGCFTNYLIPMFLHRQDRILPFNFLILFLRATEGVGVGGAQVGLEVILDLRAKNS